MRRAHESPSRRAASIQPERAASAASRVAEFRARVRRLPRRPGAIAWQTGKRERDTGELAGAMLNAGRSRRNVTATPRMACEMTQ